MITNRELEFLKNHFKNSLFLHGGREIIEIQTLYSERHAKFKACLYLNDSTISQTTRKKLKLFRNYGPKCVSCGKISSLLIRVYSPDSKKFNLYFINEDLSILTVDHIIPKSKFNKYREFFQKNRCVPMCSKCNNEKADSESFERWINFL